MAKLSYKTKQDKVKALAKKIRQFYMSLSSNKIKDDDRSEVLDYLRGSIEAFSENMLVRAVNSEIKTADTFMYRLFLENIKFTRKL